MNKNPRQILPLILLLAIFALDLAACRGGNPSATSQTDGSTTAGNSPSPQTPFERDLQYVRNGRFTYIFIFSRKDGKVLDKEDAAYLRKNAPQVVDMVTTDGGKKAIAGTNFNLELGNMELLKSRFVVEDYSGK